MREIDIFKLFYKFSSSRRRDDEAVAIKKIETKNQYKNLTVRNGVKTK